MAAEGEATGAELGLAPTIPLGVPLSNNPTTWIPGAQGQLGSALARVIPAVDPASDRRHDVRAVSALPSPEIRLVLNCAAYVNVDACEGEGADDAWAVNAHGVANVARACADAGATLVHYSTNYVFAGDWVDPYREDDLPSPRSMYGITKLAGEYAALAYNPETLVIRTAGLYGLGGNRSKGGNFVERILRAARERGSLQVVADQQLTPTFCDDLAVASLEAVERGARGIVHLTNGGSCSWFGFTLEILRLAGVEIPVEPTATVPRPASPTALRTASSTARGPTRSG